MSEDLKKRRIELGKTIEEIAEHTKIKKCCLRAIEEGKFEELPLEVYAKSYIKTYANYLNLDPQPILKKYEEFKKKRQQPEKNEVSEPKEDNISEEPKKVRTIYTKSYPKWLTTATIILGVILMIVLLIKIEKRDDKIPPHPVISKETELDKSKTEIIIQPAEHQEKSSVEDKKLKIEAVDKVWMRITIDEKEKKEFLLNPGQTIELTASKSFKLHIGNAGGVKISFNNEELGKIGDVGQVVFLNLPKDKN